MTSATVGFRPKTAIGMTGVEWSGRTVPAQNTMSEIPIGGQDAIVYFYCPSQASPPQSGTSIWKTCIAGLDIAKSLLLSGAPGMSVAASGSLTSKDYQITLDRLRGLKQDEDEEDCPSAYA